MSSTVKVDVSLVPDEDIPTCFRILCQSFGHDAPFIDIYFPDHDTPSGQAQGSKRLLLWEQSAKNSVFLKAVTQRGLRDEEHILGVGIWTLMKGLPPSDLVEVENADQVWPAKGDREFMARLWNSYVILRSQGIKESTGKGVCVLKLLAVHLDYQHLGAGTALVQWGLKTAENHGIQAAVEGTPAGRRLYEKCGMRANIEEMTFNVGDEFVGRRLPELVSLTKGP